MRFGISVYLFFWNEYDWNNGVYYHHGAYFAGIYDGCARFKDLVNKFSSTGLFIDKLYLLSISEQTITLIKSYTKAV